MNMDIEVQTEGDQLVTYWLKRLEVPGINPTSRYTVQLDILAAFNLGGLAPNRRLQNIAW